MLWKSTIKNKLTTRTMKTLIRPQAIAKAIKGKVIRKRLTNGFTYLFYDEFMDRVGEVKIFNGVNKYAFASSPTLDQGVRESTKGKYKTMEDMMESDSFMGFLV